MRVFDRVFPAASTQTYSARTASVGNDKALYLSMTAGSRLDIPVCAERMAM